MTAASDGQGKIEALEGMRGAAILLVFLVHYVVAWTIIFPASLTSQTLTARIADVAFSVGNSGVDLFMALSGYLIYDHFMRREQTLSRYFARRVRRIYPAYLVTVAIYVGLMMADPAKSKLPGSDVDTVLYVLGSASLLPGLFPLNPVVGVAWSLNYEIEFYLLLPLGVYLFGLRRKGSAARVAVLLGLVAILLLHAAIVGVHERVIMFVGGMLAREALVRFGRDVRRPMLVEAGALAMAAGTFAYLAISRGPAPYAYPQAGPAMLRAVVVLVGYSSLLAASIGIAGVCRRTFEARWLRLLGEVSFSFYLLHNLVLRIAVPLVAARVTPDLGERCFWGALPAAFALCLLAALTLYWSVERPVSLRRPMRRGGAAGPALLRGDAVAVSNR